MHQSKRNHYQSEILTAYLYKKFQDDSIDLSPFERMGYAPQRGTEEAPYVELRVFRHSGCFYQMNISYEHASFRLVFKKTLSHGAAIPENIRKVLSEFGFSQNEMFDDLLDQFQMRCSTYSAVNPLIQQICQTLKGLNND